MIAFTTAFGLASAAMTVQAAERGLLIPKLAGVAFYQRNGAGSESAGH